MEKIFTLLICVLLFANASAQHIKFTGIPVDGTISQFQSKIASRGYTYNQGKTNRLPYGQNAYNGIYKGHPAELTAFYNRKTGLVYKVKIEVGSSDVNKLITLLDKTTNEIESIYTYIPYHKLNDSKNLKYDYDILISQDSKELLGTISINATTAYYMENGKAVTSEAMLIFTYIDKTNSSLLTPSTTEPSSPFGLIKYTENWFNRNIINGVEYKKHKCFYEYVRCMNWSMDCYKYNYGIPNDFLDKEEEVEAVIIKAEENLLAELNLRYEGKPFKIYQFNDENTNELDCITFHVFERPAKLDKNQVKEMVFFLEYLKDYVVTKINGMTEYERTHYLSEVINKEVSVFIGQEKFNDVLIYEIDWEKHMTETKFIYDPSLGPKVVINASIYNIFTLGSVEEIDILINKFKEALR